MSSLHVAEFSGRPAGVNNGDLSGESAADALNTAYVLAIAASPGNSSAAFKPTTSWLLLKAGAACAFAIGAPGVQAAAGGWFLNAGDTQWVRVTPGQGYEINVVTDTP